MRYFCCRNVNGVSYFTNLIKLGDECINGFSKNIIIMISIMIIAKSSSKYPGVRSFTKTVAKWSNNVHQILSWSFLWKQLIVDLTILGYQRRMLLDPFWEQLKNDTICKIILLSELHQATGKGDPKCYPECIHGRYDKWDCRILSCLFKMFVG